MREETAKRAKKEQQTDSVKRWSAQGRTADLSGDMSRGDLKKFWFNHKFCVISNTNLLKTLTSAGFIFYFKTNIYFMIWLS